MHSYTISSPMKPLWALSHCHEFAHDMRRFSASYNSPHIATNVHELCHKRFGQNCSTISIQHVADIHGEIQVDSCDPVRVYTILVRVLRYVYESHMTFLRHVYTFLRVCRSSARSQARLYDLVRYITICYDIYTRLVRQRTNLTRFSTISHDFYTISDAFKNKKVYIRF